MALTVAESPFEVTTCSTSEGSVGLDNSSLNRTMHIIFR